VAWRTAGKEESAREREFGSPGSLPAAVVVGGYDEGARYSIVEYDRLAIRNPSPSPRCRVVVGERHRVARSSLWVPATYVITIFGPRYSRRTTELKTPTICYRRLGTIHGNVPAERTCVEQQRATRFGTNSGGQCRKKEE